MSSAFALQPVPPRMLTLRFSYSEAEIRKELAALDVK